MPRQVKIGFDKTPAPISKSYHQLVDLQGTPLTDAAGNPLVTEDNARDLAFTVASNSLPAVVGNKVKKEAIPVTEVFANESEVSSTLLGVTRAEEQLSLFADVSTYGLDPDNWNYYTVGNGKIPAAWYNRKHPIFKKRGFAEFHEETNEQALYLSSFPVQYTFPDHPNNVQDTVQASSTFGKYIRFLALGRWLYEVWAPVNLRFAEDNFLNDCIRIVDVENEPYVFDKYSAQSQNDNFDFVGTDSFRNVRYGNTATGFSTQDAMDQIEKWTLFYFKIRSDTDTYPLFTLDNGVQIPFKTDVQTGNPLIRQYIGEYQAIQKYATQDYTQPGGNPSNFTVGVLESRKTFRYQPGRVSGFTFGLRVKNNPREQSDKIEWGCANDTDQYMFQVTGSQFNIVQRSTIKIPDAVLEDPEGMNLNPADDFRTPFEDQEFNELTGTRQEPAQPPGNDKSEKMYSVVVPRSKWNGDALDGQGPSGYIIDLVNVTMYKIEFSWYGAIGAKFYAYVPVGNGDCRWILLHTWIIENKLEKPALKAADFKFRYVISNKNTGGIVEPAYIYKYGSSYYIDGGDEGNITLSGTTSDTRTFSSTNLRGSVIALHTKTRITNSFGYDPDNKAYNGILNNKKVYPITLAGISDKNVRVDITKVKVSPDGHHGTKSVSLISSDRFDKPVNVRFNNRNQIYYVESEQNPDVSDTNILTPLDANAKLIGPGMVGIYSVPIEGETDIASVGRRRKGEGNNYSIAIDPEYITVGESVTISGDLDGDGLAETVDISDGLDNNVFAAHLSGYRTIVPSDTPITANRFKIHFLNPRPIDPRSPNTSAADFAIGVTPDVPTEFTEIDGDDVIGNLKFGTSKRVYPKDPSDLTVYDDTDNFFDPQKELFVEWSRNWTAFDLATGADLREVQSGNGSRLEQDYRIRGSELPFNGTKGVLSCVQGRVETLSYDIDSVDTDLTNAPAGIIADARIIFQSLDAPVVSEKRLGRAEVGVDNQGTGYVYVTTPAVESLPDNTTIITAYVKKAYPGVPDPDTPTTGLIAVATAAGSIDAKIITLSDDNKLSLADSYQNFTISEVYDFNSQPLYLFFAMRANSRINNIIVEEISETTTTTHVPNFIGLAGTGTENQAGTLFTSVGSEFNVPNKQTSNAIVVKDVQTNSDRAPSNFISNDYLSGVKFDTQTDLPLADGEDVYSFYIGGDEAIDFGLENIFNIDRLTLTPGLYNNNALYFKATPVAATGPDSNVNVQMTITCKEQ